MTTVESPREQSADLLKDRIIVPAVCSIIQESFPDHQDLGLLDIGAGDTSSAITVIQGLSEAGIIMSRLAFVDRDLGVFPRAVEEIMAYTDLVDNPNLSIALIEPDSRRHLGPSLSSYESVFDVATLQMVAHLMDDPELSLTLCRTFFALNDEGKLIITDFNPAYLEYLLEQEPAKYQQAISPGGRVEGIYHLSGVPVPIHPRKLEELAVLLMCTGFDITRRPLSPSLATVAEAKPRYADLVEQEIPMFNIIQVEKSDRFVSFTEGVVQEISSSDDSARVIFMDGSERTFRESECWSKINPGETLVSLEVVLPNGQDGEIQTCQTIWVISEDRDVPIWTNVWISRTN